MIKGIVIKDIMIQYPIRYFDTVILPDINNCLL